MPHSIESIQQKIKGYLSQDGNQDGGALKLLLTHPFPDESAINATINTCLLKNDGKAYEIIMGIKLLGEDEQQRFFAQMGITVYPKKVII